MLRNKAVHFKLLGIFLVFAHMVCAQQIRVTHIYNRVDLGIDASKIYNYNMYEQSRWGMGLYANVPVFVNQRYSLAYQNSVYGELYGGYGTGDHAWKYGGKLQMRLPRSVTDRFEIAYSKDIEKAGQHTFDEYNLFNTSYNSTYFSTTYSDVQRITAGLRLVPNSRLTISAEARHSEEMLLFNANGLLYPRIHEEDKGFRTTYNELYISLAAYKTLQAGLLLGTAGNQYSDKISVARLLFQYRNNLTTKLKNIVSIYAQAGSTFTENTPFSRRFDLSGTAFSNYFFNNTFATVRPNSFFADAFIQTCIAYHIGKPLWKNQMSAPRPFVQLNAMWGCLRQSDNGVSHIDLRSGQNTSLPASGNDPEIISVSSPNYGVLEPAVGINGLLHWNMIDVGVAAACQWTPGKAPYHRNNFFGTFCVMLSAVFEIKYGTQIK